MDGSSVTVAILVGVFGLFGGGSIVSLVRMGHDKKLGIKTQELEEDKVLDARWQAMLDQQKKNLIDPLVERVKEQQQELNELRGKIDEVKHKYWRAVKLARELYSYIAVNIPPGGEPPPSVPSELTEDL